MRSRFTTHPRSVHAPRRLAAGLAVLALLIPAAAGCGGGGGGGGQQGNTSTTKKKTGTTARKPGPKAPRGGAVQSFSAKVVNGDRADLTVVLKTAQPLTMRVNKPAGVQNTTKVGKVKLGNKPAGRSVIPWDLKVSGHKLDPGKYSLVMRAGKAGRSKPVSLTIPG